MFTNGEHNREEGTENPKKQRGSKWERDEVGLGQPLFGGNGTKHIEGNSLEKEKGGISTDLVAKMFTGESRVLGNTGKSYVYVQLTVP